MRKRDAEITKSLIKEAAQRIFQEKGYDGTTTREIAATAGVNVALITRYFGSKKGLFEKAVLSEIDLHWITDKKGTSIAETIADFYLSKPVEDRFDGFIAMLHSISSTEVRPSIKEILIEQGLTPVIHLIDSDDARARAILVTTQITGLIFYFRAMEYESGYAEEKNDLRKHLLPYLRELLREEP